MTTVNQSDTPWTVGRLLQWTTRWFADRNVEGGRLASELLLAKAMGCRKIELYTRYDQEPTAEQRAAFREYVRQAGEHRPIAYLLGTREFYSLDFIVTPAVLVPRPETEALAERTIELCREQPDRIWHVLDVGTGSGCVAVAISRYAANARVVASDISAEALAVAAKNAERHELTGRVEFIEADCVALPAECVPEGGFDVIVSNPPYIREAAWADLPPNVRDHEPRIALTAEGSDGLVMYRRLASEAPAVIASHGRLLVEIGYDQRDAVADVFASAGGWTFVDSHRNATDPHDRVLEFAPVA